jgi:hypothetical protein
VQHNRGNRTSSRGSGFPRSALTALNKSERDAFDGVAEQHGYVVTEGRRAGKGHGLHLILAINSGEVATVLLDAEKRDKLIKWLEEQAPNAGRLEEAIRALASQLHAAAERAQALEDEDIQSAIEERR